MRPCRPSCGCVQPAQRVDAAEQVVGHAAHQLLHLAAALAVQAGEVGHAAGRAHAAEEAVALDQQRARAVARGAHAAAMPGRAAADHHDVEFAEDRRSRARLRRRRVSASCSQRFDAARRR